MNFERLIADHDAIDDLCVKLSAATNDADGDAQTASELLGSLAILVGEHILAEDQSVYAALALQPAASDNGRNVPIADSFAALCGDWQAYLSEWTPECVSADWATFCDETHAMMTRLRERVRLETGVIYPLALRLGVVTLRGPSL